MITAAHRKHFGGLIFEGALWVEENEQRRTMGRWVPSEFLTLQTIEEVPLTGVSSLVDLEVLGAGKHFAAGRKRTGERFLAGVHSDVVHQLVFGLKGAPIAGASEPEAGMGGALRASHMIHGQMGDDLLHRVEDFVARFAASIGGCRGRCRTNRGQS